MNSPSATPTLAIAILGSLAVHVDGIPMRPLRGRTGEWLLALLVLRHNRKVQRDWLAATLWPDSRENQARANLRRALTDLRQALGDAAVRLLAPTPLTLSLVLTEDEADLVAFDAAIRRGDPPSLEKAIALYRGPLLDNCLEEWVLEARMERQQEYLKALETLANRALETGEGTALPLLRRLLAADPYREGALRTLLECLAREEGFAAVTEVYREFRLRLRRDLNADPEAQTSALYQSLRSAARQRAREAQEMALRPEGEGSIKRRPVLMPERLPHPLTPLIGRHKEVAEIGSLLQEHRLVTLTGTGGVGKTRLAIQVAEEQAETFSDGVWFVGLAALSDASLVPQALSSTLGLHEEPGRSILETLTEFLRRRRLLLVLDNCEHLLTACTQLCATLLSECPEIHILGTSRQETGILGEVAWRVPSLVLPDATHQIETLLQCESVRLFVERAMAIMANFRLTERNAPAVMRICRQLDGIPLAIELAAARIRALSPEQVAARLKDRFRLLNGGNPTAMPRHQTLRACLDWSYGLLSKGEQRLLLRLSVFAGGWTLEAAEAVCADERLDAYAILDLLTSLATKSLVIANEDFSGERRYQMLETVRQYLLERLIASGEQQAAIRRHFDWYLALAEQAEPHLAGPDQLEWLERLETEHDNLRLCIAGSQEETTAAVSGLRLAGALWRFWYIRGYWSEGREYLARTLNREDAQENGVYRARALCAAGVGASLQGDYVTAKGQFEAGLRLYRDLGDRDGTAAALFSLGNVAQAESEYEAARLRYEEGLRLQSEVGDKSGVALSLGGLGSVASAQGDYSIARTQYEESLRLKQELGDRRGIAWSLSNLGYVASAQGDYTVARTRFEESLHRHREIGDKSGIAYNLIHLGMVAFHQGDRTTARAQLEEGLRLHRELGDKNGIAYALDKCAGFVAKEDSLLATRLWGAVEVLRRSIGAERQPNEQNRYDDQVREVRSLLGAEAFNAAWNKGQNMTLQQAIACVLSAE